MLVTATAVRAHDDQAASFHKQAHPEQRAWHTPGKQTGSQPAALMASTRAL